jgi:hypothetical protein
MGNLTVEKEYFCGINSGEDTEVFIYRLDKKVIAKIYCMLNVVSVQLFLFRRENFHHFRTLAEAETCVKRQAQLLSNGTIV